MFQYWQIFQKYEVLLYLEGYDNKMIMILKIQLPQ